MKDTIEKEPLTAKEASKNAHERSIGLSALWLDGILAMVEAASMSGELSVTVNTPPPTVMDQVSLSIKQRGFVIHRTDNTPSITIVRWERASVGSPSQIS